MNSLDRIKELTVSELYSVKIASLMISLYSILSSSKNPDKYLPISYLNDFCAVNKRNHLVQEQILAHFLCIFDNDLKNFVKNETLYEQFDGCPTVYWTYLHILLSNRTEIENVFPDFQKKTLLWLIGNLNKLPTHPQSIYIASLCSDIIYKNPDLFGLLEKETKDCRNNQLIKNMIDYILASLTTFKSTGFPNLSKSNYEIFDDRLSVTEVHSDGSLTASTKKANTASSYKINYLDKTPKENGNKPKIPHSSSFELVTFSKFNKFMMNFKGFQNLLPPKTKDEVDIPSTSFQNIKLNEMQLVSDEIQPIDEKIPKNMIPQQDECFVFNDYAHSKYEIMKSSSSLSSETRALFETIQKVIAKIGIIFVKKGKLKQSEILALGENETSQEYQDFLLKIREKVQLKDFKKYCGKLDILTGINGQNSIYFSDKRIETMFHVSTMMPTNQSDSQQIQKKKHIGNDNTTIVWNENINNPWNAATIVSKFNDFHVVIYPKSDNLYFIDIRKKSDTYECGPIRSPILLNSISFPYIVRWTAITSDFLIRGFTNPLNMPHYKFNEQLAKMANLSNKD
ncbi:Rap/ran-GAP family protein [Trichomonas vaginalis G3]|uniref:Rap/ran-GAP family protein n=1 Tax=Trichomonas vaginalis (strain ATCC PRA-98 / G3) TaxID=412133 RepID=A2DXT2_TRIV3|nr:GTPase activator protein [Trichomonas vaginalis G3]EAY14792.1 Rap/ran-GAP family protein [Trichomonas vaginalis G3]KAI5508067.1 GTPase activator protein [Trichomonas vaginalis G3]|eukprot:XP_001327015.1 Rap/ran-GAP family protein [Trichomonas vaginalis G3]